MAFYDNYFSFNLQREVKYPLLEQCFRVAICENINEPPDFTEARKRSRPRQLHIYQPTIIEFNGNGNINASTTINGGSFITGLPKETMAKEKRSGNYALPASPCPGSPNADHELV
ncbi:unnamed protein product [Rhizophagus irregularis]|uniref:Uncharacterized protein n=1 Tax=Rhizophagus irregularis TaxID=588596 RepID=A0A915ZI07_9GLOM|nr:unnamed protein product [Rhizophagus irregularis]